MFGTAAGYMFGTAAGYMFGTAAGYMFGTAAGYMFGTAAGYMFGTAEVGGEPLGLDGRRRDDHLEVWPAGQELTQIAEQEVDVEAALVGLVEDEGVVAQQAAVALHFGEQDAVGHQLHQRAVAGLIGEAHGVADGFAERGAQFVGDALGDGAGREPARLGVPDSAADAAAQLQADLRQLGGLAGPGLAGDDDHLVFGDGPGDHVTPVADRQVGVGDRGNDGFAAGDERLGGGDLFADLAELLGSGPAARILEATAEPCGVADRQAVETVS